jgi:hypothetical protein
MPRAFALRAEYQGTVTVDDGEVPKYGGGVFRVGDRDVNLRDLHDAAGGDKVVVADEDTALAAVLEESIAHKEVPVKDEPVTHGPYEDRGAMDLRAELKQRGFSASTLKKEDAIVVLQAHDKAVADGDDARAASLLQDPALALTKEGDDA